MVCHFPDSKWASFSSFGPVGRSLAHLLWLQAGWVFASFRWWLGRIYVHFWSIGDLAWAKRLSLPIAEQVRSDPQDWHHSSLACRSRKLDFYYQLRSDFEMVWGLIERKGNSEWATQPQQDCIHMSCLGLLRPRALCCGWKGLHLCNQCLPRGQIVFKATSQREN